MRNKLILFASLLLAAVSGCNIANHEKPVVTAPVQSDTIILRCQSGYRDPAFGSYINLFDMQQFVHATTTDSSFVMARLDTALAATNYHMNMHLEGIKPNNSKIDIKVNCVLNLVPPADSACMFIAQCNNGTAMVFDTVYAKKDDKSFTLHINNATASYYYIVLWGLSKAPNSTVSFQDVMVTSPK